MTVFRFKFAGIRRTGRDNKLTRLEVVAANERDARRQLATDFILFLTARIRAEV